MKHYPFFTYLLVSFLLGCAETETESQLSITESDTPDVFDGHFCDSLNKTQFELKVTHDVWMDSYFESLDSICSVIQTAFGVEVNEYQLIHANHWILDSLRAQDYYIAKSMNKRIDNQRGVAIMHTGDGIRIPNQSQIDSINKMLSSVVIDVNIPEFTLRLWSGNVLLHACRVRVGKNDRRYLALAGHEVNLRTPIGEGRIVRIERDPVYMNPVDGHRYSATRRDDGHYTQLPRIPFLEPEINGVRSGALIHPTTNRSTLGKAISNGCVGLSEADAWMVYYYAPLGTRVVFRYDLQVEDSTGQIFMLRDIYPKKNTSPT